MYNRAPRTLERLEDTNTWNYSTATWRQANGSALNQFEMVRGLNEDPVQASVLTVATNSTATQRTVRAGLGLDSTTAPTGTKSASVITNTLFYFGPAGYVGAPGIGYHYLAWLEQGAGADTQTWYGDNGGTDFQAGMQGLCWS